MVLREEVALLCFSALTFLVVLPGLCRTWPHSAYHQVDSALVVSDENHRVVVVDDESLAIRQARDYLKSAAAEAVEQQLPLGLHHDDRHDRNDKGDDDDDDERIQLLVTIVTTQRKGQFYLSRVVARLHQLLNDRQRNPFFGSSSSSSSQVLICNVGHDENVEAVQLGAIFPLVQRERTPPTSHSSPPDVIEKEKEDYTFCLNASLAFRQHINQLSPINYILVLEDDALPTLDLFVVIQHFTAYLAERHPNFVYVKLYHPERLQNYIQPEPWRICEWLALSCLLSFITVTVILRRPKRFLFFVGYFMLVTESVGRVHFELALRRFFSPAFYSLLAATECCTPAMLYSNESAAKVVHFLSNITCKRGYGKDIALYLHVRQTNGLEAFVIEPNLVQHIGLKSTLRG